MAYLIIKADACQIGNRTIAENTDLKPLVPSLPVFFKHERSLLDFFFGFLSGS